ncbi:MAG: DNA-3-methyladenine glycosylase family protein [Microcystaceae cyanobacterium]
MKTMRIPPYWQDATNYLTLQDEVMAGLIASYAVEVLLNHDNPLQTLMRAVVGQQISVKAAEAIWQRLERQLETISAPQSLAVGEDDLRQCGLSRQKIGYLTAIARAFEAGTLTPSTWKRMSDEEVVTQLVGIRGIGQWTAEMFLIFHLHRPDVLPLSDLGLLKAIRLHYGHLSESEILTLSQRWQPYRTVATWYLWRSLDPGTVQY